MSYTLMVFSSAVTITPASFLPAAHPGQFFSQTFTASGGTAPYTYTVMNASTAPLNPPTGFTTFCISNEIPGISFNNNTLSGTPQYSALYYFTLAATDANNITGYKIYTLVICSPISITASSLPTGTEGVSYNTTLAATGGYGSYAWSATGLPSGLSMSSNGVISGMPTTAAGSPFSVTVTATDNYSDATSISLSLTVNAPIITLSPTSLPAATTEQSFNQTITASGGISPYTYTESGALPSGITLSSGGTLSGTTTVTGSFTITVTANDSSGYTGSQSYTLTVNAPIINPGGGGGLPNGTVGSSYSYTFSASGGIAPYAYSVSSGSLPNGLSLGSSSGILSGNPQTAGNFSFGVKVTDTNNYSGSQNCSLAIVNQEIIKLSPTTLPVATTGTWYSQTITANGGSGSYAFSVSQGSLPTGLTLGSSSGILSGTPAGSSGGTSYQITIKATDNSTGIYGYQNYSLDVSPANTTTYYVSNPNNAAIWGGDAAYDGAKAGLNSILVILDFGDSVAGGGAEGFSYNGVGEGPLSSAQITQTAENFLQGYWNYTQGKSPYIYLAIGTNNDNDGEVTYTNGQAWGNTVNTVTNWIDNQGYYTNECALGASDMEIAWGVASDTESWINGYHSTNSWYLLDYGDDCNGIGSGYGWTVNDVYYKAADVQNGDQQDIAVPEIYGSGQVTEWESLAQWACTGSSQKVPIIFWGSLTQYAANQQMDTGQYTYNPVTGWSSFYNALNANTNTSQARLLYATDVSWDNSK
jgi:hypothetical protein